nr:MAG TPA: hypothetical protein [Bacteriophage sp.]
MYLSIQVIKSCSSKCLHKYSNLSVLMNFYIIRIQLYLLLPFLQYFLTIPGL